MTPFVQMYVVISVLALVIAWFKGGHPERLGAIVWLIGWILAVLLNDVRIGELRWAIALLDVGSFAAFLWLALRHQRWWPLGVSACLVLVIAVHLSVVLIPEMTPLGEASAQLGLGVLAALILTAGAFERWLAGEAPAAPLAVWGRQRRTT